MGVVGLRRARFVGQRDAAGRGCLQRRAAPRNDGHALAAGQRMAGRGFGRGGGVAALGRRCSSCITGMALALLGCR